MLLHGSIAHTCQRASGIAALEARAEHGAARIHTWKRQLFDPERTPALGTLKESTAHRRALPRQLPKRLRVEYPAKTVIVTTPGLSVAPALIEPRVARHPGFGKQAHSFETEPQSFRIRKR